MVWGEAVNYRFGGGEALNYRLGGYLVGEGKNKKWERRGLMTRSFINYYRWNYQ